jgi:PAS domain S-box-containing protein
LLGEVEMQLPFPPAHRLARINYPSRTLSYAYSFIVVLALASERKLGGWTLAFAALTFLAYPQLAYLHARIAVDSKRAEFRNLVADCTLMGVWIAQVHFALWPACGALLALSLNNAVCGGVRRFLSGLAWCAGAAALWGAVQGYQFEPRTGPLVSGLCAVGIITYVACLGLFFQFQNRNLVRARDVLRKSEEQFRFIAEHAGDLVSVVTARGEIRYASESHVEHFEPRAFTQGGDWLELLHPDDRPGAAAFLERSLQLQQSERIRLRMVPVKGAWRIVECQANPVTTNGGETQMIVMVCRDLTARARAEIDLRLAQRAFDRLREAVLISDNSGRIEFVNKAFAELTGYSSEELVGWSTNELLAGVQTEGMFSTIWKSVERHGNWRGRYWLRAKDNRPLSLWTRVYAIRDKDSVAAHYVWMLNDGTTVLRDIRAA